MLVCIYWAAVMMECSTVPSEQVVFKPVEKEFVVQGKRYYLDTGCDPCAVHSPDIQQLHIEVNRDIIFRSGMN